MKKLIAIILSTAMLCMACSGCGNTTDVFIDPVEQINEELIIYMGNLGPNGSIDSLYNGAMTAFKTAHPNVTVTMVDAGYYGLEEGQYSEMQQKLTTELLAGKGPDLVHLNMSYGTLFDDTQKAMMSGAFYDINHSIKADKSFKRSDYYEPVLDVGVIDGKQYLFPTYFEIPILGTTQEVLEATGIKLKDCTTYDDLMDTMYNYMQDNPNETRCLLDSNFISQNYFLPQFQVIDYETQEVNINTPEMKKSLEQGKAIWERDNKLYGNKGWGGERAAEVFKKDEQIFGIFTLGNFLMRGAALVNESKELVFQPLKNVKGEFQASLEQGFVINNNSPNKQNAYDFIKIVIDPNRERIWPDDLLRHFEKHGNKPQYQFSEGAYSIAKQKTINDIKEYKRVFDEGWYEDPDYNVKNSDGTMPRENIAIKPLKASFYKDYLAMLDEITACEMYAGLYEKAHEYLYPYLYEDKKSLEACLKQAQDQLEIYISE